MKSVQKKLTASFLLLAVAASAAACGSSAPEKTPDTEAVSTAAAETTAAPETEEAFPAPELPAADYGGEDFRVLEYEKYLFVNYYDFDWKQEDAGEPINDAVMKRNQIIEDRFNCKIKAANLGDPIAEARQSILAGSDDYDLMELNIDPAVSMAMEGMFVNFYNVPHISLDMPWWDHAIQRDLALMNQIYIMTGDISMMDEELNYAVYFNKNVAQTNDIDNLYDLAKDGKWTLDRMMDLGRSVSRDLNGNGETDENDAFGALTDGGMLWLFYYTSGCTLTELDKDGIPQITVGTPRTVEVADKLAECFNEKETVLWAAHCSEQWKTLDKVFMEDRALFRPGSIYDIRFYRNMEADFGILPYPKFDESQEEYYHPIASAVCPAVCIPATSKDLDRTGVLLEALAYESRDTVTRAYYDVNLYSKLTRDDASGEMLDIIFATKRYDLGRVFNIGGMNQVFETLVRSTKGFAAEWAAREKAANKKLAETLDFFKANQN